LHVLLERVGRLGVTGLDDLLALPKLTGHPQVAKLALTDPLPRAPGVYLFRDAQGRVIYVGKATNLRQRVRSYFSGDDRRKVPQMLRETDRIDHLVCVNTLEAAVLEIRLIQHHQPRFNAQLKRWNKYSYLKLTAEAFPRLSITKAARDDGATYLGPLRSAAVARAVAEAIESAVPIRRCTAAPGRQLRAAPCTPAQLGVATCPCAGTVSAADYAPLATRVVTGITVAPRLLLDPLEAKMRDLATAERYEEAAAVRDRAAALASALERRRRVEMLRTSGRLVLELVGGGGVELHDGVLVAAWAADGNQTLLPALDPLDPVPAEASASSVPARHEIDALLAVSRWLSDHAGRYRLVSGDGAFLDQSPALPRFVPTRGLATGAASR
jgi:DNA polymerase III subunit epsilon